MNIIDTVKRLIIQIRDLYKQVGNADLNTKNLLENPDNGIEEIYVNGNQVGGAEYTIGTLAEQDITLNIDDTGKTVALEITTQNLIIPDIGDAKYAGWFVSVFGYDTDITITPAIGKNIAARINTSTGLVILNGAINQKLKFSYGNLVILRDHNTPATNGYITICGYADSVSLVAV